MKKIKKNWFIIIVGIHIAFRVVLSWFVTNDEMNTRGYEVIVESDKTDEELLNEQIVLLD